jgi:hypothetical protein
MANCPGHLWSFAWAASAHFRAQLVHLEGSVGIATTLLLLLFLAHGDQKMALQSRRILIALLFVVFIVRYATEIVGI